MRAKHKSRADNHPKSSLSHLIHKSAEERRKQYGEERYHRQKYRRYIQINSEKREQDGYAELLESYHTAIESDVVDMVKEVLKEKGFDQILETVAGATITSHCGPGTLGVLFINDGE